MLWAIIKKEFLGMVLRSQFIFASAIILVLVVLGVGMLLDEYAEDVQDRKEAQAIQRARMSEAEDMDQVVRSFQVERPIPVLRPIAGGSEKDTDPSITLGPRGVTGSTGTFDKNPIYGLLPKVDLVFIVGVFLSLVVFVLSYDAISGEREAGTIRLVFSYNVPRDTFLLGKWIGGLLSVSVPLLAGFLTAALLMLTSSDMQLGRSDWLAFGGILVLSFLYISLMYAIGLFVSARSRQSSTSISVLLFTWVVMVLIVPNAMPYIAALIRPIDNPARIQERVGIAWADINTRFWRGVHQKRQEFGRESEEYREWRDQAVIQRDEDYARVRESILGPYKNERARFARVAMGLSRLSPLSSYTYGATRLADSGPRTDEAIDEALEQLRLGLAETEAELRKNRQWGGRRDREESIDMDMLPRFQYEPAAISERLAGASTDAVILMAMTVLFFLGTYVSFLRMDLVQ